MAGPAPPDITALTTWEQVFENYSIPQVRTLHQQLQRNLEVNREKLRALVGCVMLSFVLGRSIVDPYLT